MPFRFSGHETFPCRYAWLPKAFRTIEDDPGIFADDEGAMVALGVGKNMVRAIRFWVQAARVALRTKSRGYETTDFGRAILSEGGLDPFLEDIRTLWLIHWQFSTHVEEPLFAWDYMLNRWSQSEFSRSTILPAFRREVAREERRLSDVTLGQHFDVFLHTYVPTRGQKGEIQEDNLDCPLVELELIRQTGERRADEAGRRENVYAFRVEEKPEISSQLFLYCLRDHWERRHGNEKTLTSQSISTGHGSPGQVFKLPEADIRQRLEAIASDSGGEFEYEESASLQQVSRAQGPERNPLDAIYGCSVSYA